MISGCWRRWPTVSVRRWSCGPPPRRGPSCSELGDWSGPRAAAPTIGAGASGLPDADEVVLATWRMHLDDSSAVADAPYLLDTARPPVAVLSPQTAAAAGIGGHVTVSNDHGSITLPVHLAEEMVPGVVWLPSRPRGHDVATHLAAAAGDPVTISPSSEVPLMIALNFDVFFADPWWLVLIKAVFALVFLLVMTLFTIWFERRVVGLMQHRKGPTMNGPFGLLQSLADGMKLMFKEDFTPKNAEKVVFMLAPFVMAIPAVTAIAVIPIAGVVRIPFTDITTPLQVTDLPVSVLLIVALASVGVYGIVLAGWSGGSTYSLLGAVRSSAQVISYEIAMGLALVGVFLYAGSLSTSEIVAAQAQPNFTLFGATFPLWYCVMLIPSFAIYLISMVGETNRAPFDLPEAEGELVGGFHTEYSSMRFAMFFMAEYMNMITVSALATTLVPGRLARPVPVQPGARPGPGLVGTAVVRAQGLVLPVPVRLAAGHAAPAALRPVHELRLEVADPDLAGLADGRGRVPARQPGGLVLHPDLLGHRRCRPGGPDRGHLRGRRRGDAARARRRPTARSTPSPAATRCLRRATSSCPSSPGCWSARTRRSRRTPHRPGAPTRCPPEQTHAEQTTREEQS